MNNSHREFDCGEVAECEHVPSHAHRPPDCSTKQRHCSRASFPLRGQCERDKGRGEDSEQIQRATDRDKPGSLRNVPTQERCCCNPKRPTQDVRKREKPEEWSHDCFSSRRAA